MKKSKKKRKMSYLQVFFPPFLERLELLQGNNFQLYKKENSRLRSRCDINYIKCTISSKSLHSQTQGEDMLPFQKQVQKLHSPF